MSVPIDDIPAISATSSLISFSVTFRGAASLVSVLIEPSPAGSSCSVSGVTDTDDAWLLGTSIPSVSMLRIEGVSCARGVFSRESGFPLSCSSSNANGLRLATCSDAPVLCSSVGTGPSYPVNPNEFVRSKSVSCSPVSTFWVWVISLSPDDDEAIDTEDEETGE